MRALRFAATTLLAAGLLAIPASGAQQTINTGTAANDGTGDTLRTAFGKANANFSDVYSQAAANAQNIATNASAISTANQNIATNASNISAVGANRLPQNFALLTAASGTWTVPANVMQVEVMIQAGGGGGGGSAAQTVAGGAAGAGGSSGEYLGARMVVTPGQQIAYANDANGGAGGAAGASNGANAGNSTFGQLAASGGQGGGGAAASAAGTAIALATLNATLHPALPMSTLILTIDSIGAGNNGVPASGGGQGARSLFGWGLNGLTQAVAGKGNDATGYGGGGGGGYSSASTGPFAGGKGAPGAIVVRW